MDFKRYQKLTIWSFFFRSKTKIALSANAETVKLSDYLRKKETDQSIAIFIGAMARGWVQFSNWWPIMRRKFGAVGKGRNRGITESVDIIVNLTDIFWILPIVLFLPFPSITDSLEFRADTFGDGIVDEQISISNYSLSASVSVVSWLLSILRCIWIGKKKEFNWGFRKCGDFLLGRLWEILLCGGELIVLCLLAFAFTVIRFC